MVTRVFSFQSAKNKSNAPDFIYISYYFFFVFFLFFGVVLFLGAAEVMKFLCLNEIIVLLVAITGAFSGKRPNKRNK